MPTAVAPTGNPALDGLLWGWKWDSPNLTVSFPQFVNVFTGYVDIRGFAPFTQAQIDELVDFGLSNLSVFSGLSFSPNNFGTGDIRFAQADQIQYEPSHFTPQLHVPGHLGSAEANPPDPFWIGAAASGDNWFIRGTYDTPTLGSFQYSAGLLHEMGHTLGLKHGHITQEFSADPGIVFPALPIDMDSQEFSVMTYRAHIGDGPDPASGQEEYPWTYMMLDIAAIQHMYGPNFGPGSNEGDSVYSFDPATGALTIDGNTFRPSYNAKILATMWDGGGTDTYDFSNYANDQTISLRPGEFSAFSTAQLAQLNLGRGGDPIMARGNLANSLLYQGDLRSLIENAFAGSGNDSITGNQVANLLRGNGGNDNITGAEGNDTLEGGAGNDFLIPGAGADSVDGGSGSDMVSFVDLVRGVQVDLVAGTAVSDGVTDRLQGIENVTGSIFGDYIVGDGGANRIRGLGDYDWMVGSDGADSYEGGNGRDMVSYVNATAGVTVRLDLGRGTGGQATGDTYDSIERVTGSIHNDLIYGGGAAEDFRGLGGYDWFVGSGGGKDRYDGGSGLDTVAYSAATSGVVASLLLGRGSAGDAARDLYTSIENLTGSSHDDVLTGDNGRNVLRGLYGEDIIFGNGGVDRITGGGSDDRIDGGSGWDYAFYAENRSEYAVSTSGATTFVRYLGGGGEGLDTLTNIEVLVFADGELFL